MLSTKTETTALDVAIQKMQTYLHDRLLIAWELEETPEKYKGYGRCYRNRTKDGYIAEWYLGSGEYKEVYWDDQFSAVSFFGVGSRILYEQKQVADVHLVFFVNLSELKADIAHRADEEVRKDVLELVGRGMYGLNYKSMDLWVENCLREYPGSVKKLINEVQFDMHPVHCFRLNFESFYNISDC